MTIQKNDGLKIIIDNAPAAVVKSAQGKDLPKSILAAWAAAINQGQQEFKPLKKILKKLPEYLVGYLATSSGLDLSKKLSVKNDVATTVGEQIIGLCVGRELKKVSRSLLTDKRIPANTRLIAAATIGDLSAVQSLILAGADPSEALGYACSYGQFDVVKFLLQDCNVNPADDDQMALYDAIVSGKPAIVQLLLKDKRIDPTLNDHELLYLAFEYDHPEIVEALLDHPSVKLSLPIKKEALERAVRYGRSKVVQFLLDSKRVTSQEVEEALLSLSSLIGGIKGVARILTNTSLKPSQQFLQKLKLYDIHYHDRDLKALMNATTAKVSEETTTAIFLLTDSLLRKSKQFSLPVWSIKSKHTTHHLVGSIHLSLREWTVEHSRTLKLLASHKTFIFETDQEPLLRYGWERVAIRLSLLRGDLLSYLCPDLFFLRCAKKINGKIQGLDDVEALQNSSNSQVHTNEKNPLEWTRQLLALQRHDFSTWQPDAECLERERLWIEKKGLIQTLQNSKEPVFICVGVAHCLRLIEHFHKAGLATATLLDFGNRRPK